MSNSNLNSSSNTSSDYVTKNFDISHFKSKNELRYLEKLILINSRGKKSQQQLSRALGLKFNLYGKWESGSKKLMWDDLAKILKYKKINVSEILEDTYKILDKSKTSDAGVILKHFLDFYFLGNYSKLAEYLEMSPLKIRRMIKKESPIAASIVLKLFIYRPQHFVIFLEKLQISDSMPEIKTEIARMKKIAQGQVFAPANAAVLYFLDTKEYQDCKKHSNELICQKLQLSLQQVESALRTLQANSSIEFKDPKYVLNSRSLEFPASDYKQTIPMFNYWIYRSLCYLNEKLRNNRETTIPNASSFRIFSVSKKTAEKITEKIRQTHHEILQMIKESDREDLVVRAIILNHFGLEESPPFNMKSDEDLGFIIQ